jgi:hypothetical protein
MTERLAATTEKTVNVNPYNREKLAEDVLQEWQNLLNVTAEIFSVPAGLITRVDGDEIEIFLSSETEGNPYGAAYKEHYPDSEWYCERTLKNKGLNLISNALKDPEWKDNPAAVQLHMISYLGMPIERPDGEQFGTVCFIDNKENAHNDLHIRLVHQIKRMIELSLRIIYDKDEIDYRDRLLDGLSKIYPICSYCKKVREESGNWISVEKYVFDVSGTTPSHGVCPQCFEREMKLIELEAGKIKNCGL